MNKKFFEMVEKMYSMYNDNMQICTTVHKDTYQNITTYTQYTSIDVYNYDVYTVLKEKVIDLIVNMIDYANTCEFAIETNTLCDNSIVLNFPGVADTENTVYIRLYE